MVTEGQMWLKQQQMLLFMDSEEECVKNRGIVQFRPNI